MRSLLIMRMSLLVASALLHSEWAQQCAADPLPTTIADVSAESRAGEARHPNVLLIMVDDLGYGDLACYGAPDLETPHIDRLVSRGRRLVDGLLAAVNR
jgi:hypothetical protein